MNMNKNKHLILDERYVIDPEQCISCGTCAGVCPVDAPEEDNE